MIQKTEQTRHLPDPSAARIKSVRTRRHFYEAFWQEVFEVGYPNVTVNAVIRRADATKGRFYYHFRDKLDLLRKAYRAHTEVTVTHLQKALQLGASTEETVIADVRGLLDSAPDNVTARILELDLMAMTDPELSEILQADHQTKIRHGAALVRADIERGLLRPELDPESFTRTLYSGIFGVYLMHNAMQEDGDLWPRVETMLRHLFASARGPNAAR